MKISKSILNPSLSWSRSQSRDQPMSLITCLSRKLHTNGSIKGGGQASSASSMFTTTTIGKKRDNAAEPSSPKVTCIGQVRVKTKIKKRRNNAGEVSFRKADYRQQQQQECIGQRWVHFPHTICEALRVELSCLFPCRTSEKEEEEKEEIRNDSNGQSSSCARWLVTLQDGEGGKGREVELVVGGGDEGRTCSRSRRRRHVLEDFEIKDDDMCEATVSICIPPKNALLLMRCRSDPVKAAALTNRFGKEAPVDDHEDHEYDDDNEDNVFDLHECEEAREKLEAMVEEQLDSDGKEEDLTTEMEVQDEKLEESRASYSSSLLLNSDKDEDLENTQQKEEVQDQETEATELKNEKESENEEQNHVEGEDQWMMDANEEKKQDGMSTSLVSSSSSSVLPDCLLLMMFEPKLSMEVSKETWVCSTDFVRWLPRRQRPKQVKLSAAAAAMKDNHSDEVKKMGTDSNSDNNKSRLVLPQQPPQPPMLPPRSSCSLPAAAVSMAAMIEHKLVNGVGYEPFVLTRCKSEPMRTCG